MKDQYTQEATFYTNYLCTIAVKDRKESLKVLLRENGASWHFIPIWQHVMVLWMDPEIVTKVLLPSICIVVRQSQGLLLYSSCAAQRVVGRSRMRWSTSAIIVAYCD